MRTGFRLAHAADSLSNIRTRPGGTRRVLLRSTSVTNIRQVIEGQRFGEMAVKYPFVSLESAGAIGVARQCHQLGQAALRPETEQLRKLDAIHAGHADINQGNVTG